MKSISLMRSRTAYVHLKWNVYFQQDTYYDSIFLFSWDGAVNEGIFWSFFLGFSALLMKSYLCMCTCFGLLIWGISRPDQFAKLICFDTFHVKISGRNLELPAPATPFTSSFFLVNFVILFNGTISVCGTTFQINVCFTLLKQLGFWSYEEITVVLLKNETLTANIENLRAFVKMNRRGCERHVQEN